MSGPSSSKAARPAVNGWNAEYLDQQYQAFKADPGSVSPDMAAFFQGFDLGAARPTGAETAGGSGSASPLQAAAEDLANAYRALGHLIAKIDPFGRERRRPEALTIERFGLTSADLDKPVRSEVVSGGVAPLREVIKQLEQSYCGSIGIEFMHIPSGAEREWFRRRFEGDLRPAPLSNAERITILEQLTCVDRFEFFLGKRFQGKKRFSIEGGESTIPLLKFLTQRAGELGTQEMILGMAHRGRLSVLKTYLGKDLGKLFTEFKDAWVEGTHQGGGDVKYHRGYSGDQVLPDGKVVHLSMLNNPSHLESQDAPVMGRCRAKQDLVGGGAEGKKKVASLLIHGDAALPGQGVVAECLNMTKLEGYDIGGTLHVVINNLVGFTTDPEDSRSTEYCTDIAKIVNTPVFHVNGDDPDAVVQAARLAADYRSEFGKDVFIDMVCFRRYGHNEQDEPTYTQPQLYALVKAHPGTPETYRRKLVESGVLTEQASMAMQEKELAELEAAYDHTVEKHNFVDPVPPPSGGLWAGIDGKYSFDEPKTAADPKAVAEVCAAMGGKNLPAGFNVNAKLAALLKNRAALPATDKISHADAEQIAIGTLLLEGVRVRLTGQDCRRGTFTQRQAVLRDEKTGERVTLLDTIRPDQKAFFEVFDSPLSEYSVMGFEYGYSRANPKALVMWEAQFGDFCNTAQVVIDQYMASSEVKWNRWAGLVLLLPHGYEGQGPEHSSARLERFLQLCADDNMEVVYPSTAAQTFHMLRRQTKRSFRKPLIVMTPKKFLRIETSTVKELSTGSFQHIIDDPTKPDPKSVKQVVYCTGKFYHEMHDRRAAIGRKDIAIVRIEQLCPLHVKMLKEIDARYPAAAKRIWAQEEPRNQGAFMYIADRFREDLGINLGYAGRVACASPATGSEALHVKQQQKILAEVVGALPEAATKDDHASAPSNGASPKAAAAGKANH